MDKMIVTILVIILLTILALTIGGGVFILMAYGVGWAVNHLIGVDPFQATALGLAGILVFIIFLDRILRAINLLSNYRPAPIEYDDDDEDYDDDEDDDDLDDYKIVEDEEALDKLYAGIPRWRRPTKNLDFSNVRPDDRCPCGSGRKYKNCHGAKQKKI